MGSFLRKMGSYPSQKRQLSISNGQLSISNHNVPLYLGELGTIIDSFGADRGGLRWTEDMLDLLLANKVHFAYHDYHEMSFGIYYGDNALPDPGYANTPLIELFKRKLVGLNRSK